MLVNGDRYSSAETHLSLQANHTLPFVGPDLHKILQHRAPPVSDSITGGTSPKLSASRSPPAAGYKRPNTPPHYELVRIPSPAHPTAKAANQLADASLASLSNIPRNRRGETVRSCLKPENSNVRRAYYATVPRGKKSLSFNNLLEHVCLFIRGSRVSEIPDFEQYGVKDTGDVDSPTLSASLAQLETWVIASKNTPTLPTFDWVPVRLDAVTIENSRVLAGSILVRNLDFHKTVTIRYSVDAWATSAEASASFANVITPSGHGFAGIDRFLFRIDLGKEFSTSALKGNFSFALRYEVGGETYWDNNQGNNYNLELTRAATASSSKSPSPSSSVIPTAGAQTSRQPLFPWADPAALPTNSRTTRPIRPSPSAPVFIPTFARASSPRAESPLSNSFIPVSVSQPTLCVEVAVPPGLQVSPSSSPSSSIPIPVPTSAQGHAKSAPLPIPKPSLPRTASYPPASPRSHSPSRSSPIAIAAASHRGRSPSPSLYLDSIEIPFSSASMGSMANLNISRNFHSTGIRRGGGSLYADSDNFGLGYGCSPPSPHSGFAACRA